MFPGNSPEQIFLEDKQQSAFQCGYLQSSKVVPGDERASLLRRSSLSRVTCFSWNSTVSMFSLMWPPWFSVWLGGGEEAEVGVPAGVSTSLGGGRRVRWGGHGLLATHSRPVARRRLFVLGLVSREKQKLSEA